MLQHATRVITLTGYAATAADVNRSNTITSMDAFLILQKATDLATLPFPGAGVVWLFNPSGYTYSNLTSNLSSQNFTGVLLGDVSGNWATGGVGLSPQFQLHQPNQPQASARLYVRTSLLDASGLMTATIGVTAVNAAVPSLDLALTYSSMAVTPVSVQVNPQLTQFMSSQNTSQPGIIRVALATGAPVSGQNDLVTIVFRVHTSGSRLVITQGDIAEGAVNTTLETGYLGNHFIYMPVLRRSQ